MEIEVITLSNHDIAKFKELIDVYVSVFELENFSYPGQNQLVKLLNNPGSVVLVAMHHGKVTGGLTAHILQTYEWPSPTVYVSDLAVSADYQRQGIGKRLIEGLKNFCAGQGYQQFFIQAESDDHQAVNFYRSTPISEEIHAIQFNYNIEKSQ
ncbi:MAG: GNAT family N-acetyltransferase [Saprospiraceae bacterium]|nr:GNAT family N-acetyltransferase [Saprospiraceae bacterium]